MTAERRAWTQPMCRSCFAAWSLGQGASPHRQPAEVSELVPLEPCLICGSQTRIYTRVDPKLTEGLVFAQLKPEPEATG